MQYMGSFTQYDAVHGGVAVPQACLGLGLLAILSDSLS
jgi:hypothetical protein